MRGVGAAHKTVVVAKEDRKRKGGSPMPTENKTQSAKKKQPDEKKTGFERGLEPEKILGKWGWHLAKVCLAACYADFPSTFAVEHAYFRSICDIDGIDG